MFYNFTFAKKYIKTGSIVTAYLNMFNKLKTFWEIQVEMLNSFFCSQDLKLTFKEKATLRNNNWSKMCDGYKYRSLGNNKTPVNMFSLHDFDPCSPFFYGSDVLRTIQEL